MLVGQLQEQKKLYERGSLSRYWLAQTANRLGDTQDALGYLENCAQSHDEALLLVGEDPTFDNLHKNPAFQQLLARIGLWEEN